MILFPRLVAHIRSLWRSVGDYPALQVKPSVFPDALRIPIGRGIPSGAQEPLPYILSPTPDRVRRGRYSGRPAAASSAGQEALRSKPTRRAGSVRRDTSLAPVLSARRAALGNKAKRPLKAFFFLLPFFLLQEKRKNGRRKTAPPIGPSDRFQI